MSAEEEFNKLVRKEVRELLKRHVYFSQEILALISQNFGLKRKLDKREKQIKLLAKKFKELNQLIKDKKRKP
jgi:translation elongation factor EF-Tu-like GTPase